MKSRVCVNKYIKKMKAIQIFIKSKKLLQKAKRLLQTHL